MNNHDVIALTDESREDPCTAVWASECWQLPGSHPPLESVLGAL